MKAISPLLQKSSHILTSKTSGETLPQTNFNHASLTTSLRSSHQRSPELGLREIAIPQASSNEQVAPAPLTDRGPRHELLLKAKAISQNSPTLAESQRASSRSSLNHVETALQSKFAYG